MRGVQKHKSANPMNKIEITVPDNVKQVTDSATGVVACCVMVVVGIVKGVLAAVKYVFGGVFRIIAGAVAGGCAAATSK